MEVCIFHGLTDSEKSIIPDSVSNTLQERWKTKCDQTDTLQVKFEQFKTNNGTLRNLRWKLLTLDVNKEEILFVFAVITSKESSNNKKILQLNFAW